MRKFSYSISVSSLLMILLLSFILAVQPVYSFEESVVGNPGKNNKPNKPNLNNYKSNKETTYRFHGYIIQFKNKPLLKLKEDLERAGKSSGYIDSELESKKKRLSETHSKFKNKVSEALNKEVLKERKVEKLSSKGAENKISLLGSYKTVFNGIALNISYEEKEKIEDLEGVKRVYPNFYFETTLMDSVPLVKADDVWGLKGPKDRYLRGKNISIGIIDTGVDYTHPDLGNCTQSEFLSGKCEKVRGGYDFVNNDKNPIDNLGHGTHCAGIAAGKGDHNKNGKQDEGEVWGVAPNAQLNAYKVCNKNGCPLDSIIAAVEKSVDPNQDGNFSDHLDIISMSLGGPGDPGDPISQAVDNAVENGVIAVVAAGNSGPPKRTIGSPGTAMKAITVGATFKKNYSGNYWGVPDPRKDIAAPFSSRGPVYLGEGSMLKPDVVAPGAIICSARYDDIYSEGSHPYYKPCFDEKHVQIAGTSQAAPMVSGIAALTLQKHPKWTPEEIKMALRNKAEKPMSNYKYVRIYGYGRVNAFKTINSERPPIAHLSTKRLDKHKGLISGTASSENLDNYSIYYGKGYSPEGWTLMCSSTHQVVEGTLCKDLTFGKLNQKQDYTLKLSVADENGEVSEDKIFTTVHKAYITSPRNDDSYLVGDNINISGTATGLGLSANYSISYGLGLYPKEFYSEQITLKEKGKSEVINGMLGRWNTSSLREGHYKIRMSVYVEYNNGSVKKLQTAVKNITLKELQEDLCTNNSDCEPQEFCEYKTCGSDQGTCKRKVNSKRCGRLAKDPVCGCNGKTYQNDCYRQAASVSQAYPWSCINQITDEDCKNQNQCPNYQRCIEFPGIGKRCAKKGPCSYFNCSEVSENSVCIKEESFYLAPGKPYAPFQVKCTGNCVSDEDCGKEEFCNKHPCDSKAGICTEVPEECSQNTSPVCGCNGKTYENDCLRKKSEVSINYEGECIPEISNVSCDISDQYKNTCDFIGNCSQFPGIGRRCAEPTGFEYYPCPEGYELFNELYMFPDFVFKCVCKSDSCKNCSSDSDCKETQYKDRECLKFKKCPPEYEAGKCRSLSCNSSKVSITSKCVAKDCYSGSPPVCGCDGKTYENICSLMEAGVVLNHEGKCRDWISERECGPDNPCPSSLKCINFPESGSRCAKPEPCYYYDCPEGTECKVTLSYPRKVVCSDKEGCEGESCETGVSYDTETGNVTYMSGKESNVTINKVQGNKGILQDNGYNITSEKSLQIKNSKLIMKTSKGEKEIEVSPERAVRTSGISEKSVKDIRLKEVSNRPVYSVKGKEKAKILGIISTSMNVESKIDAQSGEKVEVNRPWWHFLAW